MIEQRTLTNKRCSTVKPSFLFDVGKLAAPADRWQTHDGKSTHRTDGTQVVIRIEDINDDSRTKFVVSLHEELNARQKARLLDVVAASGEKKRYTRTRNERAPYYY